MILHIPVSKLKSSFWWSSPLICKMKLFWAILYVPIHAVTDYFCWRKVVIILRVFYLRSVFYAVHYFSFFYISQNLHLWRFDLVKAVWFRIKLSQSHNIIGTAITLYMKLIWFSFFFSVMWSLVWSH